MELKNKLIAQDADLPFTMEWDGVPDDVAEAVADADVALAASWPLPTNDGKAVMPEPEAMAAAGTVIRGRAIRIGAADDIGLPESVNRIAGVDISFVKGDAVRAAASLVVLSYPALDVVYTDIWPVELDQPYIPGFLAFREVGFFVEAFERLRATAPELVPDVVLVDGNGVLHRRGFGLASHLGVLIDVPTIGIGKSFYHVDGVSQEDIVATSREVLTAAGDALLVVGESGRVWGAAFRASESRKALYVSSGHRVGLLSALRIVRACARYRIPEPVRQADLLSRDYVRDVMLGDQASA
ncbi:endonuclease V family protein [Thecamonas trahens ATCC 50062]|uniref:Endonuclease V family protein n=1 Tax=Thecamonas trahens ATCC 50062 TaxID=461836 RepID=A0A0L0D7R4_THETB|nr:endonuclease V family protein [Thecamonas trahens ATCC 50062]KNC48245.1 endonuclease V family protein [Thecamonas trahens ATCC 50062]|eukprot:XP_013758814.1 endonuclease V family protein [Thecamonas trahens ATCC 50062]